MEKQKKILFIAAVAFTLFMSSFVLAINDPVAHWKLDETSGLIAEDSAGDNDGTLVNGPLWTTGIIDGALQFDGIDDYVDVGDPADGSLDFGADDSFSIAAWIRCNKTVYDTRDSVIVTKRDVSSGGVFQVGYHMKVHMDKPRFNLQDSSRRRSSVIGTSEIRDDQWHHVVAVRDTAEHKLHIYVDGIADAPAVNDVTTTLSNSDSFGIGKYQRPYSNCFGGLIDEVIIYDRALSAAEIEQLYLGEEEAELVGLEVAGPDEAAEDSQTQYSAIALYDNDSTADVTADALWSVEPNVIASIEAGLLTTEKIFQPEELEIYAQYTEDSNTFDANKPVSVFAICPSGSALQFDGVDDYVSFSQNAVRTTEFTLAMWANHYGQGGGENNANRLFSQRDASIGDNHSLVILTNENAFGDARAGIRSSLGSIQFLAAPKKDYNEWHHYAITVDSTDFIFYIDGVEVNRTTNNQAGDYVTSIDYVEIARGKSVEGTLAFLNGAVDEVCIYDRALSAQEIQMSMYLPLGANEPNLIGYWNFDEGEGQVAYDMSGNGNDGQLGTGPDIDDSDPNWVDSDAPAGICTLEGLVERNVNEALEIKLNILDEILEALAREDASLDILDGLFGELEYGHLDKRDIRRAGREIHSAIQSEEQAIHPVEKSIDDLEDSLEILGGEDEPPESSLPRDSRQTNRPLIPRKK